MVCSFKIPAVKVARLSFTSVFHIDLYLFKNAFLNDDSLKSTNPWNRNYILIINQRKEIASHFPAFKLLLSLSLIVGTINSKESQTQ